MQEQSDAFLNYSASLKRSTIECLETTQYTINGTTKPNIAKIGASDKMGKSVKRYVKNQNMLSSTSESNGPVTTLSNKDIATEPNV